MYLSTYLSILWFSTFIEVEYTLDGGGWERNDTCGSWIQISVIFVTTLNFSHFINQP